MYRKELDAYRNVVKATSTPRETEARVLTQGAVKLRECMENWDAGNRKEKLAEALKYNQKLWSIFQADVTSVDSPLPEDLRINILKLSIFIDKQIFSALAHPSPEKLAPIIDINLSLAAGLRTKPAVEPQEIPPEAVNRGVKIQG